MNAATTPTPWYHRDDLGQVGSVEDASGNIVAQVQQIDVSDRAADVARRNADAALIARAVNAYPALVDAVRGLLQALERANDASSEGGLMLCEEVTAAYLALSTLGEPK